MRKSSLGRRSSTHIPIRVPSLGASGSSAIRSCSGERRTTVGSGLKQPGFASQGQYRRSQSEDRESYGARSTLMVRSNTAGTLPGRGLGAMTPVTPNNRPSDFHNFLPSGSTKSSRKHGPTTESNKRASSFGGKNSRKDSRPLSEKDFQQAAQMKVQRYFDTYAPDIVGPGNHIRPMNAKMFVDMMDHLLKNLDKRIVISKSNYLEELPKVLRMLYYRSKVDRSWLMTVNTPHSWQHVIGVLSWLVDVFECMNCVDPFAMMYGTGSDFEAPDGEEEEDENDLKIDQQFVEYGKKTYRMCNDPDVDEETFEALDLEFVEKQIIQERCADEDFEILQRQIDVVQEELEEEVKERDLYKEAAEALHQKYLAAKTDAQEFDKYMENSNRYVESNQLKILNLSQEIEVRRENLVKKKEDLKRLQDKVAGQEISVDDKENIIKEKHELQRMINAYDTAAREFEKSAFATDLKFAEDQRKLEKFIVEYNKMLAENIIVEPRLKEVEVKLTLLNNINNQELEEVDNNFKKLKEDIKKSIHTLQERMKELDNISFQLKQDAKQTEEDIAKETGLLEEAECDLQKQEELINKESQRLKKERICHEKMTKEIKDELIQFDPAKLEEKKEELRKIKHDQELMHKRAKFLMEEKMKITQEAIEKVIAKENQLRNALEELKKVAHDDG